jgi:hypothetical protein
LKASHRYGHAYAHPGLMATVEPGDLISGKTFLQSLDGIKNFNARVSENTVILATNFLCLVVCFKLTHYKDTGTPTAGPDGKVGALVWLAQIDGSIHGQVIC